MEYQYFLKLGEYRKTQDKGVDSTYYFESQLFSSEIDESHTLIPFFKITYENELNKKLISFLKT